MKLAIRIMVINGVPDLATAPIPGHRNPPTLRMIYAEKLNFILDFNSI